MSRITPYLTEPGSISGPPRRLVTNAGKSFQGSIVLGLGFVLEPDEARRLIEKNPQNRQVLFPYLNGEDLNSRPDQSPSRWVINFFDWPLPTGRIDMRTWRHAKEDQRKEWLRSGCVPEDYPDFVAEDFPDCLAIVEEKVKPERETNKYSKTAREKWWLYERWRPELYRTIAGMERVLVRSRVANINSWDFTTSRIVNSEQTVIVSEGTMDWFALLQNSFQTDWIVEYASSMRTDVRYTPSDCFETFPFPTDTSGLLAIGQTYYDHRRTIMLTRQEGLTKTYNRFHNPNETAADIQRLRDLHVEMDQAVATAYGWTNLDLGHGFHETKQGLRFTVCESARRDVLSRLLRLNHERYEEEVRQGLHGGNGKREIKGKSSKAPKKAVEAGVQGQAIIPFGEAD